MRQGDLQRLSACCFIETDLPESHSIGSWDSDFMHEFGEC